MDEPRITFGIIVLNGEPFTRYNLRALYPFAHEIIVVEGACPNAAQIATSDGHSSDGTLEILHRFKKEEDPENKITIVVSEDEGNPNGFWPGEKDEMSLAFAKRATGNWLWQVDIDEFYKPDDILHICNNYLCQPDVSTISFEQIQFWGGLDWFVDGWCLRQLGASEFHRLFRWGQGYTHATHRPPTILNEEGIDLRKLNWIRSAEMARKEIYLYHYALVFPSQVKAKSQYYSKMDWGYSRMSEWANMNYIGLKNPYRVHNVYQYPSWLEQYKGTHPPQVLKMWEDIKNNRLESPVTLRQTNDIKRLLASPWYRLGIFFLKLVPNWVVRGIDKFVKRILNAIPKSMQARLRAILYGNARYPQEQRD